MTIDRHNARAACIIVLLLAGCAAKAPFSRGGSDGNIKQSISKAWASDHSQDTPTPTIDVSNGVVNLTGTLDSAQDRIDAVRDAWQPDGVVEVVNELQLATPLTKASRRDRAMAIKLRTRLIFDTDVVSTHYSIDALDGTIYLMGFARDEAELARVKHLAEDIAGVGRVVSYVTVRPVVSN